ncbi:class I SAM-dependent methyltransferase [Actinopolymorpha pittospori]|uniref:O-methyltransferase involved in polyketide biosynthesis n=1 Tax=Actinopolymorpha pittospori TaxID=648752 RepID=A0A927NCB9_9ACTN|nr:class I SAM-dependent methyltransferase [Actinopolymorpha pittospori]MBE1612220.1 O-methyltransferase involved in polyketide biosynthesis [Actinopolymorpha pittospori]
MEQVKVRLDEAMETSLLTLYGKAIDARRKPSILGDTMAVAAIDRVDYDFTRLKSAGRVAPNAAARAKHFDNWAREFLATHERATVLHLGAGLDTRVWRLDPGPGVRWYDVDFPKVVDIRRQIFPDRDNYHLIGASVTAPEWLDKVPADLPTLIVAEGLTMYLRPEEGHELFRRITDRFPSGTLLIDGQSRLALRMVNKKLSRSLGSGQIMHWAIEDPQELVRVNPKLRFVDGVSAMTAPTTAQLPGGMRIVVAISRLVPALRDIGFYLRYEFGDTR